MPDYPLPKFHFRVEWGGASMNFTEVTGLTVEVEKIEYRHGNSNEYHKTQQPGLRKFSNITMKRGTFAGDNDYFKWVDATKLFEEKGDPKYRRDVTVKLLDEAHQPIITWKIKKAWPIKVQSADLKADANEIAIETVEFVHEGLEIENGS